MLSLRQIEDVCMLDNGADQCRYLEEDPSGTKFYCLKHTVQKSAIDEEIINYKSETGHDPFDRELPVGNNCKGYTFFRHKKQGYDVD